MIEDITIELLVSLEIDNYIKWVFDHQNVIKYSEEVKSKFPQWRTMLFNREKNRFLSGLEDSALPSEVIRQEEFKLISEGLNNFPGRSEIVSCIVNGLFFEKDCYELANVCGIIDFIKFVNDFKKIKNAIAFENILTEDGYRIFEKIKTIEIKKQSDFHKLYGALTIKGLFSNFKISQLQTVELFREIYPNLTGGESGRTGLGKFMAQFNSNKYSTKADCVSYVQKLTDFLRDR